MKKNGFTLAEVLITLAIIGVVATLTLPALMTNTGEQQAKTALKKGINTLTEAAQMSQVIAGYDYAGCLVADTSDPDKQSLYGLLASRTSVDFGQSGKGKQISYQGTAGTDANSGNYTVFFRDGASLSFPTTTTSLAGNGAKAANAIQSDGLPYGMAVLYDTNGRKGPNIVSNCEAKLAGLAKETSVQDPRSNTACGNKSNRVIKDQFSIRLRGGYAVPNGTAARWAFGEG
ncbi:type II secretion system protein [bacterium]|nr:type II secretion system protein [bacterium]